MATALGIDVGGIRKGLDLVLLDESRRVLNTARGVSTSSLSDVIRDWLPCCIAIDSPPKWASGRERLTETEMRRIGLQFYQTPWLPENQAKGFYLWMQHGFEVFEVAHHCGFPLFDGSEIVQGKVLEVFPLRSQLSCPAATGRGISLKRSGVVKFLQPSTWSWGNS